MASEAARLMVVCNQNFTLNLAIGNQSVPFLGNRETLFQSTNQSGKYSNEHVTARNSPGKMLSSNLEVKLQV